MLLALNYAMLAALILGILNLLVWRFRSKDEFQVLNQYSALTRFRLTVPIPMRWERHASASDVPSLRRFRRGLIRNTVIMMVPVAVFGTAATSLSYIEYRRAITDAEELQLEIESLREQVYDSNR